MAFTHDSRMCSSRSWSLAVPGRILKKSDTLQTNERSERTFDFSGLHLVYGHGGGEVGVLVAICRHDRTEFIVKSSGSTYLAVEAFLPLHYGNSTFCLCTHMRMSLTTPYQYPCLAWRRFNNWWHTQISQGSISHVFRPEYGLQFSVSHFINRGS